MKYYVFHTAEDFWKTVKEYKTLGYTWIQENHPLYEPTITDKDMPVVLNADDNKTLMFGIVSFYKERYFADTKFIKLYTNSLRKKKLEKIAIYDTTN